MQQVAKLPEEFKYSKDPLKELAVSLGDEPQEIKFHFMSPFGRSWSPLINYDLYKCKCDHCLEGVYVHNEKPRPDDFPWEPRPKPRPKP